MEIQNFHEILLDFLLKDKSLRFTLRKERANNEDKFNKGYWFLGGDGWLNVSFWDAHDGINKTPNIFLGINANGSIWFECVDRTGGEKAAFFEEIAPILDLLRLKTKRQERDRWLWQKSYDDKGDFENRLYLFLKKDKLIIDALIQTKGKSHLFPPIQDSVFEADLKYILSRRKSVIKEAKQNVSIRLKKVVLDNIGHFNDIEINVDKQVTCFIGENGSGKTSILQAIALCLAGISDNNVIDPSANKGAIKNMLRINKVDGAKEIFVAKGRIEVVYEPFQHNFTNFKFTKGEMVLETGKIVRDLIDVDDRGSDATNTYDNFFKDLTIGFSQTKANRNRAEKANPERRPRISEVTALIYKLEDESFNYFQDWILDIWADTTLNADRQAKLVVLKEIFDVIGRIVGNHFELMPMEINQSQVFIKTAEAVNGIPMRLISQGYYNVIGWVGYFMQRLWEVWTISPHYGETDFKQCPALVLIDEIDTYLHPKWQAGLLDILAKSFPKTQFVVTTHSPYIVTHLENNHNTVKVYQVTSTDVSEIFTTGRDLATVSTEYFGVQRRPMFYQKLIDEVFADFDYYENGNYNGSLNKLKQKIIYLEQLLGKSDPDIETANRLFDTLKMLTTPEE